MTTSPCRGTSGRYTTSVSPEKTQTSTIDASTKNMTVDLAITYSLRSPWSSDRSPPGSFEGLGCERDPSAGSCSPRRRRSSKLRRLHCLAGSTIHGVDAGWGTLPRVISPISNMLSTNCLKRLLYMLMMLHRKIALRALSAMSSH